MGSKLAVPVEVIARRIHFVRGHRVMLDADLAQLYGVTTFNLNKAVKRNTDRFPADFMFQLVDAEAHGLRFQIGMSNPGGRGGRRYLPYAFTKEGVAMLSSVLRSKRAVRVNVAIMRAFVKLRELIEIDRGLVHRIDAMEKKYDSQIGFLFDAIGKRMEAPARPGRRIGFVADDRK